MAELTLWPRWLDRIYWRWYLKRHPVQTVAPTAAFIAEMIRRMWYKHQRALVEALELQTEELRWLRSA